MLRIIKDQIRTINNRRRELRLLRKPCKMLPNGFLFSGRSQYFATRGYEPYQTYLISKILSNVEVFVNIGAHHGYYCCLALNKGIKTIAFEPNPMNIAMLTKHVGVNKFSKNFTLINSAVGSSKGTHEFYGGGFTGSLLKSHNHAPLQERQLVSVVTLDETIKTKRLELLILVDVEGFELEVLKGANKTLEKKPCWIIEVLPNHENKTKFVEVFKYMEAHHYDAWLIDEKNKKIKKFFVNTAKSILDGKYECDGTNFLFVPSGKKNIEKIIAEAKL
ncbi:FkbM family methyltransferase [Amylibacter sp.]|nr:FkbM family methyltransferase [Amylibacter sp.]